MQAVMHIILSTNGAWLGKFHCPMWMWSMMVKQWNLLTSNHWTSWTTWHKKHLNCWWVVAPTWMMGKRSWNHSGKLIPIYTRHTVFSKNKSLSVLYPTLLLWRFMEMRDVVWKEATPPFLWWRLAWGWTLGPTGSTKRVLRLARIVALMSQPGKGYAWTIVPQLQPWTLPAIRLRTWNSILSWQNLFWLRFLRRTRN